MNIKLFFLLIHTFLLTYAGFAQPTVQISDDDWTSNSSNGACACDVDFNNGAFLNFFDAGGSSSIMITL